MRLLLSLLLTLTGCAGLTSSNPESITTPAQVVFIDPLLRGIDGDTVYIKLEGYRYGNLACIDAPEPGQDPWGVIAARRLTELINNPSLQIKILSVDSNNVPSLIIKDNNGNIQSRLVEEGLAVVLPDCILSEELSEFEDKAKGNGAGIWSDKDFILPAEYRKDKVRNY